MSIMITSDISKQYLLTEDAVEGLNIAVENGQVRLALQILTEVIGGIMHVLDVITSDDEEEEDIQEEHKTAEVKKEKEETQTPALEKIEAPAKKTVKQEKSDTQEV